MTRASLARRCIGGLAPLLAPEQRHQGLQMVAAVGLAYACSRWAGLPENLWAVMTTLIVMRPNAASTADAALDRAASTLLGACCGLAGVYVEQLGANPLAITLAVVALLAYAGAAMPGLRGAPIAALIVLSASSLAGHSALQVAALRLVQVGIGIAAATFVAMATARYRAGTRLRQGCARLLRGAAARLARLGEPGQADEAPPDREATRHALARLMALARSADRVTLGFGREAAAGRGAQQRIAGLTALIVQDVGVLARTLQAGRTHLDADAARAALRDARAALAASADLLDGRGGADLPGLRALSATPALRFDDAAPLTLPTALVTAPLLLLRDDLHRLVECARSDRAAARS
jgi:uncharacterized membrane protein YccC